MKAASQTIADDCESASSLFADVVDFTPLAQRLPAAEVVGKGPPWRPGTSWDLGRTTVARSRAFTRRRAGRTALIGLSELICSDVVKSIDR
jgi:hypothetical protein